MGDDSGISGSAAGDSADWLRPEELAALRRRGFDGLVHGKVAELLARSSHAEQLRLARYEQFAGREEASDERLRLLIADPACPPEVARAARSQQRLGAAFEPALAVERIDWFRSQPPSELDAVGIRERIAIAWGRQITDGNDAAEPRPEGFTPPGWQDQERLIDQAYSALRRRLALAKLPEFLELFDLSIWMATLLQSDNDNARALEIVEVTRKAQIRHGLHVLDSFLDYQAGEAYTGMLDLAAAQPLIEQGIAGFVESQDKRWWMRAKAFQALVASISRTSMPPDIGRLERMLVSGTWRNGRRSLGQATLMLLSLALATCGDLEGARRLALADGEVSELIVPATARSYVIEIVFNSALAEGDVETCERMLELVHRLMASPTVKTVRERLDTAMEAYRRGAPPAPLPALDEDPTFEAIRTRWMILAQTVAHGSREQAWTALADFDAFTGRTEAAAIRQRAIRLLHDRVVTLDADALSPRQLEVAALAASGHSNAEIASQLFLSRRTVEDYVAQALKRLGLNHRSELASAELPLELRGRGSSDALRLPIRQGQVGALISAGASNAEIADVLAISTKTLDAHIASLKKRLGASTRTEVAAIFAG